MTRKMTIKKESRDEFRRMLKDFETLKALSKYLGCSYGNARVMRHRGYISEKYAKKAEKKSNGFYLARLLVKKEEG